MKRLATAIVLWLSMGSLWAMDSGGAGAASGPADWVRALTLQDYNTRLVVTSSALLGVAGGVVGGFLLLRKRSLMGDTLSHATLPGIAVAFLIQVKMGGSGKNLSWLLLGAAVFAGLGFASVLMIRRLTRVKDDAAMGIVLSVSFGFGVVLLGMIQSMPSGSAAGLERFIYGKAASMVFGDFVVIATVTLAALALALLLTKEFRLLCFDEGFAAAQGWPVHSLDVIMLCMVTAVTVAGLHAVGLILVIAFLITPAAAARFWTERFGISLALAGVLGGVSGWVGSSVSALTPQAPAGSVIVLVAAGVFLLSLFVGPRRGALARWRRERALKRSIRQQHLLRAAYEWLERSRTVASPVGAGGRTIPIDELVAQRSWSRSEVLAEIRSQYDHALVERFDDHIVVLTEAGFRFAERVTRNHRLWEIYLIEYADIAPCHVDRDADAIEHVLGEEMVHRLEALQSNADRISARAGTVPESPHE